MMLYRKFLVVALTALVLVGGFASAGQAWPTWHNRSEPAREDVVAAPGLSIGVGDNEFNDRWNRAEVNDRARFCHNVRHDCDLGGRYSRACKLKWKYCSPQHRDYGYYYNR